MSLRVTRGSIPRWLVVPLVTALLGTLVAGAPAPHAEARPRLTVSILARGLTIPWDITWVGSLMLFNERSGKVWSKRGSAAPRRVSAPLGDLFASGEGGLMGMVADPAAGTNRRFYVCYTSASGGAPRDVRVVRWRLTSDTTAVRDGRNPVVVGGMPITSGRHSGCRLRFGPDGQLYVGTGDAATSSAPQNLQSLGGKVLRVGRNGTIPTDNPFYGRGGNARYVVSYGHRNLQGLAFRPGTGELWTAEHGPDRDDEVNLIRRGANYGWAPGPGYNESVPMTDRTRFPAAVPAVWRSGGPPTVAPSGLTFLADPTWGRWQGALVVGLLRGRGIKLLYLDPATKVVSQNTIREVSAYGRIRTVQYGPDGALYFTTANGQGTDVVGRIAPRATPPRVAAGTNISPVAPSGVRTDGDLYAFVRTTGDRVKYRRSPDDGRTWPTGWTDTGLTSAGAPSVASSARGRVDLVTRRPDRGITHTWLVDGVRRGQSDLGGLMTAATVSSLGDGTLDVLGLSPAGNAYRRHFDGRTWGSWQRLAGGPFTSALGASASPATRSTLVTVRGTTGRTYERTLTPTGNGTRWVPVSGLLWSGRALGDRFPGRPLIGMARTYDGMARWQRGGMTMALELSITSAPDVVTRPDGTWVLLARNGRGALLAYDARPGGYAARDLGGVVR